MSTVDHCVLCGERKRDLHSLHRKATYAQSRCLPLTDITERIKRVKASLAECRMSGHARLAEAVAHAHGQT